MLSKHSATFNCIVGGVEDRCVTDFSSASGRCRKGKHNKSRAQKAVIFNHQHHTTAESLKWYMLQYVRM